MKMFQENSLTTTTRNTLMATRLLIRWPLTTFTIYVLIFCEKTLNYRLDILCCKALLSRLFSIKSTIKISPTTLSLSGCVSRGSGYCKPHGQGLAPPQPVLLHLCSQRRRQEYPPQGRYHRVSHVHCSAPNCLTHDFVLLLWFGHLVTYQLFSFWPLSKKVRVHYQCQL